MTAGTPDVAGVLMCLSCHDGNYAQGAMMKNKVYETLPATYGTGNIPTLLGNDYTGTGNYLNDHPVGLNAVMTCGGAYDWDCSISGTGAVQMTGSCLKQVRYELWLLRQPGHVQRNTSCHVHDLPQPALDERGEGNQRSEVGAAERNVSDDVLHSRSLQPGKHDRWKQPDGTILPPVPRWRVERNEQRKCGYYILDSLCMRGGVALSLPFLLNGGQFR